MIKKIFVVMPFSEANGRDQASLTRFFADYIKDPIENHAKLAGKYDVTRSGDAFVMLDKIVEDLARADIVICDLSGPRSNPNVMYELGIRLATSHNPTILIREESPENAGIFDIHGLYTHPYSMGDTKSLEKWVVSKIVEYEENLDAYESPVLKVLNHRSAFWMLLPIRKASAFLGGISSAADAHLVAFSKAVTIFLGRKGIPFAPRTPQMIFEDLQKIADRTSLDDFGYQISSIPSLDSYLSSVYLLGLVDDDIERRFRECAMSYSLAFNRGNASLFSDNKLDEFARYAFETLILMNLSRLIIRILDSRQGSNERKNLAVEFFENAARSTL
ncbi:hypothetical protein [Paraburkholderia haematera]|uniref:Nucleoside 2-deoxyribosyltransferase n=1 Tax=Paraburkholderia haematera TaxID=2793077 RepID=A0ABN7MY45_9BURK|nr:hypothetical protein [Paraburkholderia haematera]CAE6837609.1 hypothetical protein R69888_06844 [Paraburkholderia haematera]